MEFWYWVLIVALAFLLVFFGMICYIPQYEPEVGVWFCEELQIQLDYDGSETFITENGEKIDCGCGSDRGVKVLYVSCQEREHPKYELGELIFSADIIDLDDSTFTVFHEQSQQEYVFYRIK